MSDFILLGAGGHAKALVEAIAELEGTIVAYIDPQPADWLNVRHETEETAVSPEDGSVITGIGGLSPTKLHKRLEMLDRFLTRRFTANALIHPTAHVSASAVLAVGVSILAGAVIQPEAKIGRGVIINTNATVEHDSVVGCGTHIAPGAIVLGDCRIGECCFIGAGAIVFQGRSVPDGTFLPALSSYTGD